MSSSDPIAPVASSSTDMQSQMLLPPEIMDCIISDHVAKFIKCRDEGGEDFSLKVMPLLQSCKYIKNITIKHLYTTISIHSKAQFVAFITRPSITSYQFITSITTEIDQKAIGTEISDEQLARYATKLRTKVKKLLKQEGVGEVEGKREGGGLLAEGAKYYCKCGRMPNLSIIEVLGVQDMRIGHNVEVRTAEYYTLSQVTHLHLDVINPKPYHWTPFDFFSEGRLQVLVVELSWQTDLWGDPDDDEWEFQDNHLQSCNTSQIDTLVRELPNSLKLPGSVKKVRLLPSRLEPHMLCGISGQLFHPRLELKATCKGECGHANEANDAKRKACKPGEQAIVKLVALIHQCTTIVRDLLLKPPTPEPGSESADTPASPALDVTGHDGSISGADGGRP